MWGKSVKALQCGVLALSLGIVTPAFEALRADEARPAQSPQTAQTRQAAVEVLADEMMEVLRGAELMAILSHESRNNATQIAKTFFDNPPGHDFEAAMAALYDPARNTGQLREALGHVLVADDAALIRAALDYYRAEAGQKLLTLDLSAREVMLVPGVSEAAHATLVAAENPGDPLAARLKQSRRFIAAGDMLERNVAMALNSGLAFARGFADGAGTALQEGQVLIDLWGQEAEIRSEMESWLLAYLLLAYGPLDDAEMEASIGFVESAPGRALSRVLITAFDQVFTANSQEFGGMIARRMTGQEI